MNDYSANILVNAQNFNTKIKIKIKRKCYKPVNINNF